MMRISKPCPKKDHQDFNSRIGEGRTKLQIVLLIDQLDHLN